MRPTDINLPSLVVDVSALQRYDLANPKATLASEQNDWVRAPDDGLCRVESLRIIADVAGRGFFRLFFHEPDAFRGVDRG